MLNFEIYITLDSTFYYQANYKISEITHTVFSLYDLTGSHLQ